MSGTGDNVKAFNDGDEDRLLNKAQAKQTLVP